MKEFMPERRSSLYRHLGSTMFYHVLPCSAMADDTVLSHFGPPATPLILTVILDRLQHHSWRGVNGTRVLLQCGCAPALHCARHPSCLPEALPPIVHSISRP